MAFFVIEWAVLVLGFAVHLLVGRSSRQSAGSRSMFQWELGRADIAFGVLGVACAWRLNPGGWLTATVVGTSHRAAHRPSPRRPERHPSAFRG
ncbi:MAG TPA: DUF6790 family protein [Pseudonocardiaceae bacterium]